MKKIYLLLLLITFFPTVNWAQNSASSAGTSSLLFLRSAVSVRASGLAEAYTAVADDENAILYNPAGLANIAATSFSLNHTEWLEDIRFDNLIFAYKFNYKLSAAFSFAHMWLPAIQGKDQFGNNTNDINISSSIIQLGVAYKVHPSMYLGAGMKYFNDKLADNSASGLAFDAGFYMYTAVRGLTFGLSAQNIGGKVKYINSRQKIPFTYRAGLAYKISRLPLNFSLDFVKSTDTENYFNFGTEYIFDNKYSIQAGNQFRQNNTFTPSFGAGLKIKDQYNLFYSFASPSELGSTHRIGIKFEFDPPERTFTPRSSVSRPQPLPVPTGLTLLYYDNKLELNWQKDGNRLYNVYARDTENKWKKLNSEPIKENYIIFSNPRINKNYTFCITTVDDNRESSFSKEATIHVDK